MSNDRYFIVLVLLCFFIRICYLMLFLVSRQRFKKPLFLLFPLFLLLIFYFLRTNKLTKSNKQKKNPYRLNFYIWL